MKKSSFLLVFLIVLTGCTKDSSSLTCELLEEERVERAKAVDYWSDLSKKRELTLDEKSLSWKDGDSYIEVLKEMDSSGCEY